jgi:hypothetical protein
MLIESCSGRRERELVKDIKTFWIFLLDHQDLKIWKGGQALYPVGSMPGPHSKGRSAAQVGELLSATLLTRCWSALFSVLDTLLR